MLTDWFGKSDGGEGGGGIISCNKTYHACMQPKLLDYMFKRFWSGPKLSLILMPIYIH